MKRAPGAEIMKEFFRRASRRGYSSYFFGDTETTLAKLREKLADAWPGHRVAGNWSPPFRPLSAQEDQEAIERINDARPDVLWVGLGAPRQDRWIHERLPRLRVPVAIGVGAAFAFIAGTVERCPEWMGSMGLEWAHRFAKEPKKLWRRDLIDGPKIPFPSGDGAGRATQLLGAIDEFRLISREAPQQRSIGWSLDQDFATLARQIFFIAAMYSLLMLAVTSFGCGVRPDAALPDACDPLGRGGST